MRTACLFALVLLALFASYPASATSYVPVTDAALVDFAPVIAVVEVRDTDSGPESARPSTMYRVRVERVLKGAMAPGLVVRVRVPGGIRKNGLALRIWGAPRFQRGERALLFPADRVQPGTSNLNFAGGQVRANNVILLLSATPAQAFQVAAGMAGTGTVDLIVDVNGWFE